MSALTTPEKLDQLLELKFDSWGPLMGW
ncbi:protein of unknown function [Kyrpidia spormannii]|uniref:Uncharacterized protein n=2 Tax=Kyrpidia spormannii TaxID=2055160 RepID=A0ACA8Z8V5_9BACL|nr:protein of unknown function [Kyrpidia spormannii]CAB3392231.1 protein of unknown function [Kyrpidia spormannii]